ncbi:amidase family protein [Streptomyces tibetensis]|uniref:amidase family protein n=1 Tax=Streptomyces tibetensis TaxID=2382123 RepID=UPI003400C2E6
MPRCGVCARPEPGGSLSAPRGPRPYRARHEDSPVIHHTPQRARADGRLDAERLTRSYLDRIERVDPLLHAVIEVNPDALREARRLGARRGPRRPLHGMPVLLKDLVETADRMHTTAGSLALEGLRPAADATVAARLREAGAVILGKTNLSEWAGGMSLTHQAGWSARGGQTRNPYKLDRSPNDGLEIVEKLDFGEREYREALATNHRLSRAEGIDAVLREHHLDALVMPTSGPPAKIDLIRGDAHGGGSSTPAALAGYPAVSVPAGFAFGLPVGLTFMGTAWSEPTLLRLAYAYEQATRTRRSPPYRCPDVGF